MAPGQFAALRAPTQLLTGTDNVPVMIEATDRAVAAIPDAIVRVLDGHEHVAHRTDPKMVAAIVRELIAS